MAALKVSRARYIESDRAAFGLGEVGADNDAHISMDTIFIRRRRPIYIIRRTAVFRISGNLLGSVMKRKRKMTKCLLMGEILNIGRI
jgi:hypothetical protein